MDIDEHISCLLSGQILGEKPLRLLCDTVKNILMEESNCQPVSSPVTVCGDIHGQFYDLLELFKQGGQLPESRYVFIGDYVDRGYHSVETFQLLMCYKVKYPGQITLLRGNHESRQITQIYGFYDEIIQKYGNSNAWFYCTDVFDFLPLSALIDSRIFCIHGGLSPYIKTIDQLRTLQRSVEIPQEGAFCDLMWSDPEEVGTWRQSGRGAGWLFGDQVVDQWNWNNGVELIARAHQLVMEGYKFWFEKQNLVTVWSAPNYCYRCGNVASILLFDENLEKKFIVFNSVPQSAKSVNPKNIFPYFL